MFRPKDIKREVQQLFTFRCYKKTFAEYVVTAAPQSSQFVKSCRKLHNQLADQNCNAVWQ
jgi:hypothetical protein